MSICTLLHVYLWAIFLILLQPSRCIKLIWVIINIWITMSCPHVSSDKCSRWHCSPVGKGERLEWYTLGYIYKDSFVTVVSIDAELLLILGRKWGNLPTPRGVILEHSARKLSSLYIWLIASLVHPNSAVTPIISSRSEWMHSDLGRQREVRCDLLSATSKEIVRMWSRTKLSPR